MPWRSSAGIELLAGPDVIIAGYLMEIHEKTNASFDILHLEKQVLLISSQWFDLKETHLPMLLQDVVPKIFTALRASPKDCFVWMGQLY